MACNVSQFNLGIRNILLGKSVFQKSCINIKPDVSGSLAGKYFVYHASNAKYVVYYTVDNGTTILGTQPVVSGQNVTFIPVLIDINESANSIAILTGNALTQYVSSFDVNGNELEILALTDGYQLETRDALDAGLKTSFNFNTPVFGSKQVDLGGTNGDISFTISESTKEIKSPQTGDFLLAEIRKGASVSVKFELKDTSPDSIRRALNFYGSTIETDIEGAKITGYGSHNLFKSTDDVATQLILRPTDKTAENDATEDLTIHKCKLKLGELTLSAENELVLPIEGLGYLDTTKNGFANLFSYGDASALPTV